MALSNGRLDIPSTQEWVEFPITDSFVTIKNNSNVEVEYRFNNIDGIPHSLTLKESLSAINQTVYFRCKYEGTISTHLEVTDGVEQTVAIANFSQGLGSNWAIKLDSWGLQKVSQDYRLWRDTFYSGISDKVWNTTVLNGTSVARQGSGVFSSGTSSDDFYTSFSRKHPRYQPNSGILFSTAGSVPNMNTTGGIRRFGIATIENGYFFEVAEDGKMYTVVRQSDFQNIIATQDQTTFSFDYNILVTSTIYVRVKLNGSNLWSDITADIASIDTGNNEVEMSTSLNADDEICIVSVNDLKNDISTNLVDRNIDISQQVLYDIQAQWRGAGNITFTIRSETNIGVNTGFVATFRNLGQTDRANISNPALSAFIECKNISADGTDFQLKLGCMNISAEGGQADISEYESVVSPNAPTIEVDDTDNDEVFLMIAHVPKFYKGRWNTRDCDILRTSAWGDQKCHMNIYSTFNPLFLSGALSLKDKCPDSCVMYDNNLNSDNSTARNDEIDLSTLDILTRARVQIDNTNSISSPSKAVENVITAGQYIVLTGQRELSAGNAQMGGSIEIGERT